MNRPYIICFTFFMTDLKNKRVLITCGPTWVAIDAMRVISNQSSGQMGQILAEDFRKAGAKVTLLEGPVTRPLTAKAITVKKFKFYDEFARLIKSELKKKYDICIHAAAVSDYKVKNPRPTKLSSSLKKLKLELVPAAKIIQQIKRINPDIFLVGFKLESTLTQSAAREKARGLIKSADCDLVVANSVRGQKYLGFIINKDSEIIVQRRSRKEMSRALVKKIISKVI